MAGCAARVFGIVALLLLVATRTSAGLEGSRSSVPIPDLATLIPRHMPASAADPSETARLVERRCVVCHGCYDAPCQLKLSSPDGLVRGGSMQQVHNATRLTDARPTRLGIDATTADGWRSLGFHPVPAVTDPGSSVMARLLALGRENAFTPGQPLPGDLDTDAALACPAPGEIDDCAAAFPNRGMPFDIAALSDTEFATFGRWILSGEPLPARAVAIPDRIRSQISDWQDFLNAADTRGRMERLRELFLRPGWTVSQLPPYGLREGSNPFKNFAAIPAEARYRFLPDDALFFVRSFIRGPVCHGRVATDVVEDRFWVAFLDPEADLSVTDPRFPDGAKSLLKLPVSTADGTLFERLWPVLHDGHRAWLKHRDDAYAASRPHRSGFRLSDV